MNVSEFVDAIDGDQWQVQQYESAVRLGSEAWLPLWSTWGRPGDALWGSTYSCLLVPNRVADALQESGWDLRLDASRPGFSVSYAGGAQLVSYERIGSDGVEPLVHVRQPVERFRGGFILSDELLLLFDLHQADDGNWYLFDEAGHEQLGVTVEPELVRAQTALIRRYQAVRQMALELTIDSDVSDEDLAPLGEVRAELRTQDTCFSYFRAPLEGNRKWASRLLGKRILAPPPIEDCGLWPYEGARQHETFIINVDDLGRPIEYSADPDGLANYFGANPGAPQYVTPVTFHRNVLEKYYRSPDKYSVEDGYLRRGSFWGIRVDNDSPDVVTVMLGDLGRDLPYSEQKYWRSFNIPGKGRFSETASRRGFLNEFADAASPDLQFQRLYREVNEAWQRRGGWPLFLDPSPDDIHLLRQVRVLAEDQQPAFDEQVLGLAKLLVDALNEDQLTKTVGPGPEEEKGISKLERFLSAEGVVSADSIIDTLRKLQSIRSAGAAHRKGKRFEKLRSAAPSKDRRQWFADLLEQAIISLEELRAFALSERRTV